MNSEFMVSTSMKFSDSQNLAKSLYNYFAGWMSSGFDVIVLKGLRLCWQLVTLCYWKLFSSLR